MYLHQEVAQPARPPFKRLPWTHYPHILCSMGGLTVASLNFKLFLIAYADDQAVADVGPGTQGWPWTWFWGELPAPMQRGPPPPQGGLATGQPPSICRVPAQRASLVLAKATPLPCHPWQQRGLVVVPAALQFHHLGAKGAAISHLLPPSLRRERLRATLTDFMGSPAASGQLPLEFPLQISLQLLVWFPMQFPVHFPVQFPLGCPLQFTLQLPVHFSLIPTAIPSAISTLIPTVIPLAFPSALHFSRWLLLQFPLQSPGAPQGWPCWSITEHGFYLSLGKALGRGQSWEMKRTRWLFFFSNVRSGSVASQGH